MRAKGVFASIDAIAGIMAFSAAFLVFTLSNAAAQNAAYLRIGDSASYAWANARLQHAVFLIDKLGMNISDAQRQLNYDIGAGNYSITQQAPDGTHSIVRIVTIGKAVYYIEVNLNGS